MVESKETNPKDARAASEGRLQFSVIPWRAVPRMPASPAEWMVYTEVALALAEGAWKYGRHNYRVAGVRASVYFDAAMRHLVALEMGEEIDPDSGVHHCAKAIAGLLVLRDAIIGGAWTDDRPPHPWANCGEYEERTPDLGPDDAMHALRLWWDQSEPEETLDDAIDALVDARAEAFKGTRHVLEWRRLSREGVAALRARMGDTPHTPPYTAVEVAAVQHDTEPPTCPREDCCQCEPCIHFEPHAGPRD